MIWRVCISGFALVLILYCFFKTEWRTVISTFTWLDKWLFLCVFLLHFCGALRSVWCNYLCFCAVLPAKFQCSKPQPLLGGGREQGACMVSGITWKLVQILTSCWGFLYFLMYLDHLYCFCSLSSLPDVPFLLLENSPMWNWVQIRNRILPESVLIGLLCHSQIQLF